MCKGLKRIGLVAALLAVGGLSFSACVLSAEPGGASVSTSYYSPMYYNGYIVYYDTAGLPLYYIGGAAYYVPATHGQYHSYRHHYTTHRTHYSQWYSSRGHRYKATGRATPVRHGGKAKHGAKGRRR
jgi:hypothetical protein